MAFSFKNPGRTPLVMGILNLNQDSFYPDSQCHSTDEAMVMAQRMVDEGADLLDVGAESSRPGSPLDTRLSVLEYMEKTLGDRFRPATLMRKYVAAGRLGRKVGKGVYEYDENGKRIG